MAFYANYSEEVLLKKYLIHNFKVHEFTFINSVLERISISRSVVNIGGGKIVLVAVHEGILNVFREVEPIRCFFFIYSIR